MEQAVHEAAVRPVHVLDDSRTGGEHQRDVDVGHVAPVHGGDDIDRELAADDAGDLDGAPRVRAGREQPGLEHGWDAARDEGAGAVVAVAGGPVQELGNQEGVAIRRFEDLGRQGQDPPLHDGRSPVRPTERALKPAISTSRELGWRTTSDSTGPTRFAETGSVHGAKTTTITNAASRSSAEMNASVRNEEASVHCRVVHRHEHGTSTSDVPQRQRHRLHHAERSRGTLAISAVEPSSCRQDDAAQCRPVGTDDGRARQRVEAVEELRHDVTPTPHRRRTGLVDASARTRP